MLYEICNDLGIRPGPVYDEYVDRLKESREIPKTYRVRVPVEQHVGFDRIYNDLPILINTISATYPECYLLELADYEPLPDTEWVIFFVPGLGFIRLYTSLFYDLGCYVDVIFPNRKQRNSAKRVANDIAEALNGFYRCRARKEVSLSHG